MPTVAIYVITTGGTIEKIYSERDGSVENVDGKIDRYLRLLRLLRLPDCEVNVVPLMNKDSLRLTDEDRILLLGMVRAILNEKRRLSSRTGRTRWSKPASICGKRCLM